MNRQMNLVILGLSITSSWGNGHATTYRGLVRHLHAAGHRVLFLERDVPWYAENRDLPNPPFGRTALYQTLDALKTQFEASVRNADAVIVGSYVPDGPEVIDWVLDVASGVTAFYDIDTPVTLSRLQAGDCEYLHARQVPEFDLYLSFTGGPILDQLETGFGARSARPLYCSVDSDHYYPQPLDRRWVLGYMGTYSDDRQPALERLLLDPARTMSDQPFVVAGPQYPAEVLWPDNVERIEHLPPDAHCRFYNQQRFTLNITRRDMIRVGYAPSVRLFEAAACGVPIISDFWVGLETFFKPGEEILIAREGEDVIEHLESVTDEEARQIGARARNVVLTHHTARHRADELVGIVRETLRDRRVAI